MSWRRIWLAVLVSTLCAPVRAPLFAQAETNDDITKIIHGDWRKHIDVLRRHLDDKDPQLRIKIIELLYYTPVDDLDAVFVHGLKDPDIEVRIATAELLVVACSSVLERAAWRSRPPEDDSVLAAFLTGRTRPKWMNATVEPLQAMLHAGEAKERLCAALALLPLGHTDDGLAEINAIATRQNRLPESASGAMAWLYWDQRLDFFNRWLPLADNGRGVGLLAGCMLARNPQLGLARLWEVLGQDKASPTLAVPVGADILAAYAKPDERRLAPGHQNCIRAISAVLAELTRFAEEGTPWQKTFAVACLIKVSSPSAAELAEAIYDDPATEPMFRHDAFQLLLLAEPDRRAEKTAVGAVASKDTEIRRLALIYLAAGCQGIERFHQWFSVRYRHEFSRQPFDLDPPAGLTLEMLKPLLTDPDEEIAAAAGCLAALLDNSSGLPALERVYRAARDEGNSEAWSLALYRALAALDDDQNLPLLEDAYQHAWSKERFYWTIRPMRSPGAVKLREQIRAEVGMGALRQALLR